MINKLKQIYYEFRHQPVIGWITIIGTSLAMFLVMVVIIMQSVETASFPPESKRSKLIFGSGICLKSNKKRGYSQMSGYLSYPTAKMLYDSIPGISDISYGTTVSPKDISINRGGIINADIKEIDNNFFNIYDYKFISGKPIDAASFESGLNVAIITEDIARSLFNSTDVTGHEISINHKPYNIVGVVNNASALATNAYAQVFIPFTSTGNDKGWDDFRGNIIVDMIMDGSKSIEEIRGIIENRYKKWNVQLAKDSLEAVYLGQPYTVEQRAIGIGTNVAPETGKKNKMRMMLIFILLLIPAINLSTMAHSRLRPRLGEIGIRRAFGSTRTRIISDIIIENFFVTLIGGIIGYIFSIIFCRMFMGLIFTSASTQMTASTAILDPMMVLNPQTVLSIFLLCFILNILSSGIPAWQASRINPVEAIGHNSK